MKNFKFTMPPKTLMTLLLLTLFLCLPQVLLAEEQAQPFTLNAKPVPDIVAKVNGVALKAEILEREFFAFRFQSQRMGKEIKLNEEPAVAREILKQMVARELVVQKAESLGIKITQEKIDLQLKNVEDQFPSRDTFITALAFQHMSIESLKEKIHRTLLEDELMRREIAPDVKVGDEKIKEYYDKNLERFTKPVLYRLSHIHITTQPPAQKLDDPASQKKAERLIKAMNADAKDKINAVLKKLQAGDNFADLAKHFSEDKASKDKGGFLGELHPGSTLPEISKAMLKLKEGESSSIVQSSLGYHILKLDEIIPSQLIPFADTKVDIMNHLLKVETQTLFTTYVEELGKKANIQVLI
ncbi:MAG: hypothetical protein HOH38_04620 [Nitrospinaceae bacterium]|nr:hypothetical protein [Nitrospina sp.]MBT5868102.1 hypothetical protein [Nitrospinaceae bacterium]MBT6347239.1 hypothetical protein [Nitrospina sp.]